MHIILFLRSVHYNNNNNNHKYYFVNHKLCCILNELLTLATSDIIHIKPILLKSGYSSILCFKTTLNSSKFLVLILALFRCAHHINMPSAETRIKVALKESLLYLMCGYSWFIYLQYILYIF